MDRRGNMRSHSKKKIALYREYLRNYLSVMTNQRYYKNIFIWEPFAGRGKYNGEEGSALVAAKTIEEFLEQAQGNGKNIKLILNELDQENYEKLKESIQDYSSFTQVYDDEGEDFLKAVIEEIKNTQFRTIHNLFFIDPFGYTQYTQESLNKLLGIANADYLIFLPTHHIYRFKNSSDNPARRFVLDFGVEEGLIKDLNDVDKFANALLKKFKERAMTEFCYSYKLKSRQNTFHLFFITKNERGAEKFLEAKNKIKDAMKEIQMTLFDFESDELENQLKKELKNFLKEFRTNKEIYTKGLILGALPKDLTKILMEWERNNEIEINTQFERRRGAFYLSSNSDKIIELKHIGQ